MKKHNFSAGPGILPDEVIEKAADAVRDFNGSGLSILEISHRSPAFEAVMDRSEALVRQLLGIGDDYGVIFLTGGASTQFFMVPMNLLHQDQKAVYADTGVWGTKAIKEAKLFGNVDMVCTGKESNYSIIPKDFAVPNDAKYFHITTNNTIYGTQWQKIPKTSNSMVAD
ncbi:MAG TPA: aminotransferase class V-fold PLP-dependent enzyme, partial [Saprospiraceae bacterium]|nr:aminotransferase class V-fold PLP-dependent enzyme [Saprospiraceae bacterium]